MMGLKTLSLSEAWALLRVTFFYIFFISFLYLQLAPVGAVRGFSTQGAFLIFF
jgi:hypothetical protein